ncbi:hypothetical protein C8J56DRAFT_1100284 [Mycena floridula]|nr:hypothetical protein C8J56DRAFT_1100284 [Mycena floridula]
MPFQAATKKVIRGNYNQTCAICLKKLTESGSHCAHLFDTSSVGQQQIDFAISLGILDPSPNKNYDRDSAYNGIVLCPTCHLEYFTPGLLVLSPPIELLQWLEKALDESQQPVWKAQGKVLEMLPYRNNYLLVPILKESTTIQLYCNLPTQNKNAADDAARIFDFRYAWKLSPNPGILYFQADTEDSNRWRLQVPCNVILAILIWRTASLISNRREVRLAQDIRAKLFARTPSPPFSILEPSDDVLASDSEDGELLEASLAGPMTVSYVLIRSLCNVAQDAQPKSRGKRTLKNKCCLFPTRGNTGRYCKRCYVCVRKIEDSVIGVPLQAESTVIGLSIMERTWRSFAEQQRPETAVLLQFGALGIAGSGLLAVRLLLSRSH